MQLKLIVVPYVSCTFSIQYCSAAKVCGRIQWNIPNRLPSTEYASSRDARPDVSADRYFADSAILNLDTDMDTMLWIFYGYALCLDFITSAEEGGVCLSVCLSVCPSDYSQTCERILTEFFGGVVLWKLGRPSKIRPTVSSRQNIPAV